MGGSRKHSAASRRNCLSRPTHIQSFHHSSDHADAFRSFSSTFACDDVPMSPRACTLAHPSAAKPKVSGNRSQRPACYSIRCISTRVARIGKVAYRRITCPAPPKMGQLVAHLTSPGLRYEVYAARAFVRMVPSRARSLLYACVDEDDQSDHTYSATCEADQVEADSASLLIL